MAYHLSEPALAPCNPTGKNRVWEIFPLSSKTRPANRRQSLQPRREIRPTATKTASGIPYWPSRDPIGERGGLNLYGFVGNDGVDKVDFLGQEEEAFDTRGKAVDKARDVVGGLTKTSRESGVAEFGTFYTNAANWRTIKKYAYETNSGIGHSINFNVYPHPTLEDAGFVSILFGVEYHISVYCCGQGSSKKFKLSSAIRGFFPSQTQYWNDSIRGLVNVDDEAPGDCPNATKVADLHTHNFGAGVVRSGGIEDFTVLGLPALASSDDISGKKDGIDFYIVTENGGEFGATSY